MMAFQKKLKVKVKFMSAFVFYLWLHLRQAFRTATNFLYNTSLSRNTRSRTLGQLFNHSSWKLMQVNSTCSKTLKLQNVCKMLVKRVKQGTLYGVIFQGLSNSFKVMHGNLTTIETSTDPAICIFRRSNLIFQLIFSKFLNICVFCDVIISKLFPKLYIMYQGW